MTLADRVAQLIIMPCYGDSPGSETAEWKKFHRWVRELHVGGLIVLNRSENGLVRNAQPFEMAVFLNRMQKLARIPLLVGGDFERGASMRVADFPAFPFSMAFAAAGDPEAARFEGAETAREARALGVQWVFAPDADVNNNPDNPVIGTRSYSEDPQVAAEYVAAFIGGAHSDPANPVLVTAKHFPGHGDTAEDSHEGLAHLTADRERIERLELVPFRSAIAHQVDAVMTAHIAVPALDPTGVPATISRPILTGVLRDELHFNGITVTDAMDMKGLSAGYSAGEAAVRSLEAGADVLLMPTDPDAVIRAVLAAIRSGRITRRRLDESVTKVLSAKARLRLNVSRLVDVESIGDALERREAVTRAQQIANRAVTLVRDDQHLVPLANPEKSCWLVVVEDRYSQLGRVLIREALHRAPALTLNRFDPGMPASQLDQAAKDTASCDAVVAAVFASGEPEGNLPGFLDEVIAGARPVTLVALGNPYLLRRFPQVAAYLATFSTTPTSERAAVKALFGEIPIGGHLPVTIPGFAKFGDGLERHSLNGKSTQ